MSGKGTLQVIDAKGVANAWQPDESLNREWDDWNRTRQTGASGNQAGTSGSSGNAAAGAASTTTPGAASSDASGRASAALVQADRQGMRVKLDALEDDPTRYFGKQISVDGEVDDIIGPRIFKIDEAGWMDLEGEILVVLPAGTAALLREDDQVTVSGTVRQFVRAEVERDWGWLNGSPELELKLARKPVIVADRIIGGNDNRTLIIQAQNNKNGQSQNSNQAQNSNNSPVGTSGAAASGPAVGAAGSRAITDPVALTTGDASLVGRSVHLDGQTVTGVDAGHGFFIGPRENQLFVLTQYLQDKLSINQGQKLSVDGFVMQMPDGARSNLSAPGALNQHIYVYATELK